MDKAALRTRMIEQRSKLNANEVTSKSSTITAQLISTIDWKNTTSLHVYKSNNQWNEVRTDELVAYIQSNYPAINLVIGAPTKTANLPMDQFDCIVVPLLAFDDSRNRLGFGGGWYDRFLSLQKNAVTIGLAYESQHLDALLVEQHDVPLSRIITEDSVYE